MSLVNLPKHTSNHNGANWEDMNQFLNQYDSTLALNSNNTEFIWLYLKTALNSALNLYGPRISVRNKSTQVVQPWNPT